MAHSAIDNPRVDHPNVNSQTDRARGVGIHSAFDHPNPMKYKSTVTGQHLQQVTTSYNTGQGTNRCAMCFWPVFPFITNYRYGYLREGSGPARLAAERPLHTRRGAAPPARRGAAYLPASMVAVPELRNRYHFVWWVSIRVRSIGDALT